MAAITTHQYQAPLLFPDVDDEAVGELAPLSHAAASDPAAAWDTALHVAATAGQTGLVQLLLEKQTAVDAVDSQGATALHKAAKHGHAAVAPTAAGQTGRSRCP